MKIETGQVHQSPQQFIGQEPSAILELEQDKLLKVTSPVRYSLSAQRFAAELLVRGELKVEISSRCARCGEPASQTVGDKAFTRSYPLGSTNQSIDLTADIREAILLALPTNFLCLPACRGLCPACGANLNKEACGCDQRPPESGWDALDKLKLK